MKQETYLVMYSDRVKKKILSRKTLSRRSLCSL